MPPEDNAEVEKRIKDSVSIALVDAKFQEILNRLNEIREDIKDHEARLRILENQVKEKADKEDVNTLSQSVTQLKERLSLWQVGQFIFTAVSGVVATIVSILLGGHKLP